MGFKVLFKVIKAIIIISDAYTLTQTYTYYDTYTFFFQCFATTQLVRQVQQERTQVVCGNKEARKRLARSHSRNGPETVINFVLK